jgi:chromosome segregation ATPase
MSTVQMLSHDAHSAQNTRGLMERSKSSGHVAYSNTPEILRKAAEVSSVKEHALKLERERSLLDDKASKLQVQCDDLQAKLDQAVTERKDMAEQLMVAKAEVRRLEKTIEQADATIKEHREDKQTLLSRTAEAESLVDAMRREVRASDEDRTHLQERYSVAQAERRMVDEQVKHLSQQLDAATQRNNDADEKLQALRAERAELHASLSVAQAERRMLDEQITVADARASADVASLRMQLDASEARLARSDQHIEEMRALKAKAETEAADVRQGLNTSQAETKLLQDLCLHQLKKIQDDIGNIIKERDAMMRAQQIAAKSQVGLPSGWSCHLDPIHGIPYYVNQQSGQTTW